MEILALLLCLFRLVIAAKEDICHLTPHAGEVKWNESLMSDSHYSYSYDPESNKCFSFLYGGTGGNANNFKSLQECESTCKRNPCAEKPFSGSENDTETIYCMMDYEYYSYVAESHRCVQYSYGGCGANLNHFKTLSECQKNCLS